MGRAIDTTSYFNKIYKSFKETYSALHKEKVYWRPVGETSIKIWIKDGHIFVYTDRSLRPDKEKWIRE